MASRTCWNCENVANQTRASEPTLAATGRWFMAYTCDACGVMTLGSASLPNLTKRDSVAARGLMSAHEADIRWLPERVLGRRFEDVPETIADAASEVWACYSISQYRSAILMSRAVVEAIAKDKGATAGKLVTKIDKLYDDEIISRSVKDAAHEIRFLGNDMAHGDFITPVTEEEADDILNFLEALLEEVYQRDARLNRRRAARQQAKLTS